MPTGREIFAAIGRSATDWAKFMAEYTMYKEQKKFEERRLQVSEASLELNRRDTERAEREEERNIRKDELYNRYLESIVQANEDQINKTAEVEALTDKITAAAKRYDLDPSDKNLEELGSLTREFQIKVGKGDLVVDEIRDRKYKILSYAFSLFPYYELGKPKMQEALKRVLTDDWADAGEMLGYAVESGLLTPDQKDALGGMLMSGKEVYDTIQGLQKEYRVDHPPPEHNWEFYYDLFQNPKKYEDLVKNSPQFGWIDLYATKYGWKDKFWGEGNKPTRPPEEMQQLAIQFTQGLNDRYSQMARNWAVDQFGLNYQAMLDLDVAWPGVSNPSKTPPATSIQDRLDQDISFGSGKASGNRGASGEFGIKKPELGLGKARDFLRSNAGIVPEVGNRIMAGVAPEMVKQARTATGMVKKSSDWLGDMLYGK